MLGDSKECTETNSQHPGGKLTAKAGEIGVLLEFALSKLRESGGAAVYSAEFMIAGSCMSQFLSATREMNYVVTQRQRDHLVGLACMFLRACEASGVHQKHLWRSPEAYLAISASM